MPCYHPLSGWLSKRVGESGKRSVVFNLQDGFSDKSVQVPCGRCIGCRLERSRNWAIRCMHESKMHEASCFVTLTYEVPPEGGSLRPRDFVLFMKRLRKKFGPVRFFQCGEYGERLERPHHHALLFGIEFPDMKRISWSGDSPLYSSCVLESLWGHGLCWIGDVSFESAGYVARYALKKVTGPPAGEHYAGRVPEYGTMSRRPGIGASWYEKYVQDVFPEGRITLRGGVKSGVPRFYRERFSKQFPYVAGVFGRFAKAELAADVDNLPERLLVREVCTQAKVDMLKRSYEL